MFPEKVIGKLRSKGVEKSWQVVESDGSEKRDSETEGLWGADTEERRDLGAWMFNTPRQAFLGDVKSMGVDMGVGMKVSLV